MWQGLSLTMISKLKQVLAEWIAEGYIEGELTLEPECYVLWQPDELEEINQDYQLCEFAPEFITFGGNGGGELLVINDKEEVFYIPTIGISPKAAIKIANNLKTFKQSMSK